ncbi:MAG: prolipoprotein diacylglyceryl transferase [Dehalococcoidia bacterium]|jgi:phosphatidylglycerol:prolipoprotein diacylglycerol transferase|nr:prolipoprotein diacylglyceryl transferase [Dehalococcoidia bacterium]
MIIAGWNPIAFTIGDLTVRWYGVMVSLAVLTIFVVMWRESRRLGISEDLLLNLFLWGMIGGLVMSRVVHVVDRMVLNPGQPVDWLGFDGLGLYGAILGVPLSAFIYTSIMHIPWSRMARVGDAVALGAPLGQAIGRVGCFLNGCCHGGITDGPCAVVYEHPQSFAEYPGMPVHPAQLYLVAWNLIVFLVVFLIRKKPKPEGASFLIYLILYSAGDFVVRFFRTNDPYALGLQQSQVIGLGIIAVCVPILVLKWRRFLRDEAASAVSVEA